MPHSAMKKSILSKITESVNVRIINPKMPIPFFAVSGLVCYAFVPEKQTEALKCPLVLEFLQCHICQKGPNIWAEN
jgi:hypothetical protein